MFLIIEIWPNIIVLILMANQFEKNNLYQHIKVFKTAMQYLKNSKDIESSYKEK